MASITSISTCFLVWFSLSAALYEHSTDFCQDQVSTLPWQATASLSLLTRRLAKLQLDVGSIAFHLLGLLCMCLRSSFTLLFLAWKAHHAAFCPPHHCLPPAQ